VNENKVYGQLSMMELLLQEHREGKLHLSDLVRSLNKRIDTVNKEFAKKVLR